MPKHKEGYVSREIARLQKHRSIVSIAQSMHESIGSRVSECAPETILDEWAKTLQFYENYWSVLNSEYDFVVRLLIRAALSEYKEHTTKGKHSGH